MIHVWYQHISHSKCRLSTLYGWICKHQSKTYKPIKTFKNLYSGEYGEYGPLFFSPKYFPVYIMYYQIQKADRPAIRVTDHPFSVPNHKRTRKTDQQKKIHTFTVIYMHQLTDQLRLDSLMGPAVAGSAKGPALA